MTTIFDLGGKVALVTGASGGLGLHFARTLSAASTKVALAAHRKEQLEAKPRRSRPLTRRPSRSP